MKNIIGIKKINRLLKYSIDKNLITPSEKIIVIIPIRKVVIFNLE